MTFTTLQPNIFYTDIKVGLELFRDCLGFQVTYDDLNSEHPFGVLEKDGLSFCMHQSKEFAEKDRPELRLHTENIEEVYKQVSENFPQLLHPNGKKITLKPWGAKEFAILDSSGLCLIIQQWN